MSNKAKLSVFLLAFVLICMTVVTATLLESENKLKSELKATNSNNNLLHDRLDKLTKNLKDTQAEVQKLRSEASTLQAQNSNLSKKIQQDAQHDTPLASRYMGHDDRVINMVSTAYTAYCSGCSGVTTLGINLREHPDSKVIAVDPSVIPLGSKVYIEGFGYAIAADTGGAIKNNRIDIFMPNRQDAISWGIRKVKVTILK